MRGCSSRGRRRSCSRSPRWTRSPTAGRRSTSAPARAAWRSRSRSPAPAPGWRRSILSGDALAVARENALALGAEVEFVEGDLYAPLPPGRRFDVIVANPPYIPSGQIEGLSREVRREPRLALDGGPDGLSILARVVGGAPGRLHPGGALLAEMHEAHLDALPRLCREAGFASALACRDLAGLPRYVVARLPASA